MIAWPLVRLLRSVRDRAETIDQLLAPTCAAPTVESYVRYLRDVYAFVAGVAPALSCSKFASYRIHARAAELVDELQHWGEREEDVAALARRANGSVPAMAFTEPEALGWLFVVERALLQATRMRYTLLQCEELDVEREAWLELGRHMTSCIDHDGMQSLIYAARDAFDALEDWMRGPRPITIVAGTLSLEEALARHFA